MSTPDFTFSFALLYSANPTTSAAFYTELLQRDPVQASETFVMIPLNKTVMLGIWARDTVAPKVTAEQGGSEIAFTVDSPADVDALYSDWNGRGYTFAQTPTEMDFGYTFVVLDPDNNRLRVLAPAG